nr:MAG TPA: hypothetical protein [Caudoviricetes sp.]
MEVKSNYVGRYLLTKNRKTPVGNRAPFSHILLNSSSYLRTSFAT